MSMFTLVSAITRKISAALPGTSGTPTIVTLASDRSWATPETMGCSMGAPSSRVMVSFGSGMIQVPSWSEKEERTWIGTPNRRAYSTERRCRTLAPEAASSRVSSEERRPSLRAEGTTRGSAEYTPSTSV